MLNFPAEGIVTTINHIAAPKRNIVTIIDPLGDSDAPGDKAAIHHILVRYEPKRIPKGRPSLQTELYTVHPLHKDHLPFPLSMAEPKL